MAQNMISQELGVVIAVTILSTLMLTARIVSKFFVARLPGPDDYIMLAAWMVTVGYSLTLCWGTTVGIGSHTTDIAEESYTALRKCLYALSVLYIPAYALIQTSVLTFYIRLARNAQNYLRYASFIVMGIVVIEATIMTFLSIFQCRPVSLVWSSTLVHQQCFAPLTLFLVAAPINIVTAAAILIMPLPVLTRTHLPTKQKFILILTFLVAGFASVVDVVRVYYLEQAQLHGVGELAGNQLFDPKKDYVWYGSYAFGWGAIVLNVAIVCACVPSVKPLIAKMMPYMIYAKGLPRTRTTMSSMTNSTLDTQQQTTTGTRNLIKGSGGTASKAQQGPGKEGSAISASMDQKQIRNKKRRRFKSRGGNKFFNLSGPKNLLKVDTRHSIKYCSIVSVLFFILGFSSGLLNYLNLTDNKVADVKPDVGLALITAYYAGYLLCPLFIGLPILKYYGFRICFVVGLLIYAIGCIIFWPSAVLLSYPGFVISNFVVGGGLAIVEAAATIYVVLCGPRKYAAVRILTCESTMAICMIISKAIGFELIYKEGNNPTLLPIQWTYLAVFYSMLFVAIFFYYVPFPEATDEQLEEQTNEIETMSSAPRSLPNGQPVWIYTCILGLLALFCYYGCQELTNVLGDIAVSAPPPPPPPSSSTSSATSGPPGSPGPSGPPGDSGQGGPATESPPGTVASSSVHLTQLGYNLLVPALVAICRLLGAALCLVIHPSIVLLGTLLGALVVNVLDAYVVFSLPGTVALMLLSWCCFASVVPLVAALLIQDMGRRTKLIGVLNICSQIAAGSWVWVLTGRHGSFTFIQPMLLAVSLLFPIYLNLAPTVRRRLKLIYCSRPRPAMRRLSSGKTEQSQESANQILSVPPFMNTEPLRSHGLDLEAEAPKQDI